MKFFSRTLRKKIIRLYHEGLTTEEIAERVRGSVAGVRRVRQRFRETGSLDRKKYKPGPKPLLLEHDMEKLKSLVTTHPDATLAEIRLLLGVTVHIATLSRAIRRLKMRRKT